MTPNNKRLSRLKKKNRKRNLAHSPPPSNTCIDDDHSRTSSSNSRSNSNSRSIAKANTALHHQNVEANIKVTDPNNTNGRRSPSSGGYGGGNSGSNSGENNKINSLFEFAATKKKKTTNTNNVNTNNVNTNVNQGNAMKNDDNDEDTGINNNHNNSNNINNNKKNENDNTCDIDDTKSGRGTDINTDINADDEVILVKTTNDNDNNNDDDHSLRFNNHTGSKKKIFTIHERQYDEESKVVSTAPAKKHGNGNSNAPTSMEMGMGVEIATKTRMCTVQNSTKSKSKNYFCSPFEILQLDTGTNTRICTSINDDTKCDSTNDGSSRQKKKLKYYDQSYYAALVESYIQNEFEDNDNKDDNDNDNDERINKGYIRNCVTDTHTTNDNSNNCSFYDHPILGKIHFEQPKNNKYQGDIHKTTSMNNPLSFPKIDNTNVNTNNQGCTHRTRDNGKGRNWCIVGASIHLDLLSFPKKSYDDNYLNKHNHNHNHDLPIPMKTSGILKIICYQGATVRNKYEIDDEDVELFRLSKDDIREFVDVKWLPPPPLSQHGSNTIQDSSSSEEEGSNLTGIFRYKIRLGRNDTTKPKNKKSSNYEEEFGWISDKSRLVDNPYWIALVL